MEFALLKSNPGAHSPGAIRLRPPLLVNDPLDEMFGQIRDWDLSNSELAVLPPCFCQLQIQRHLDLSDNPIEALPSNFGSLRVGGNLLMAENLIEELPASFGHLVVGGEAGACIYYR